MIFLLGMCFATTEHPHSFILKIPTAFWHMDMKQQITFGNVVSGNF